MVTEQNQASFYDRVGGAPTFTALVDRFYAGVAGDPTLRAMYPEEDLGPANDRLRMFLEQYWGGPKTYGEQRGHPRLRMRHMPFSIGILERDQWVACMHQAMTEVQLDPALIERLTESFMRTADWMRNR